MLDKGKNIRQEPEEPELEEDESNDEEGDARIEYNDEDDGDETLPPDSTMPPYFDPNFMPLDSNDSLFQSPNDH